MNDAKLQTHLKALFALYIALCFGFAFAVHQWNEILARQDGLVDRLDAVQKQLDQELTHSHRSGLSALKVHE